ncbi:MAG: flagellin [Bryobacteraceae bacterium]|jgi:flagellar hook-associated protein 3 FlgL
MTPSINPNSEIFLSNLQQIQNRMSTAEQQLSSGLRVSVASDDPDEISSILQLRAQIAGVQQTQENLSNVTPQVESGENAIQQAIQVLDNATSLATEAAGSTSSASQRLDEIPQVQGILQQLVSLSQTAVNGQYIFSGDLSGQPQYTLAANGTTVQQMIQPGPPGQIEDVNGVPISIGLTAQQIFDDQVGGGSGTGNPAPDNVFAAVGGLLTALQNNDSNGIQTALTNIQAASAHLNDESSFYGAAQNNLTAAGNSASQTLIQLQQQLSNEQDADAAQASLDLTQASTEEQAAMSAQAMLKPQSLFNYLG